MCVLQRHFDSEAYPSGLSEPSGRPMEVLLWNAIFDNVGNKSIIDFINDSHFYRQLLYLYFLLLFDSYFCFILAW